MKKSEQENIREFLLRHHHFSLQVISKYHPLNKEELKEYSTKLDWTWIALNEKIDWTEQLYKDLAEFIKLAVLAGNNSFPWTKEFISTNYMDLFYYVYEEVLMATLFSSNTGLPWSESFIDKYKEHWDWFDLSSNTSIPFTQKLIDKFKDQWIYELLCENPKILNDDTLKQNLNCVEPYIHECEFCHKDYEFIVEQDKFSIEELSSCPNFKWDFYLYQLIKEAIEKRTLSVDSLNFILASPYLTLDFRVVELFEDYWDYNALLYNECVSKKIIDTIEDHNWLKELMNIFPETQFDEMKELIYLETEDEENDDTVGLFDKSITETNYFKYYPEIKEYDLRELKHMQNDLKKILCNADEEYEFSCRSRLRFDKGDVDGGIKDITMAIEINPTNSAHYHNRAFMYLVIDEYQKAIDDYCKAIELNNERAIIFANLGFAREALGDLKGAKIDWETAMLKDEKVYLNYFAKAMDFLENNYLEAGIFYLDKVLKLNPKMPEAFKNRGVALERLGKNEEAERDFKKFEEMENGATN